MLAIYGVQIHESQF